MKQFKELDSEKGIFLLGIIPLLQNSFRCLHWKHLVQISVLPVRYMCSIMI